MRQPLVRALQQKQLWNRWRLKRYVHAKYLRQRQLSRPIKSIQLRAMNKIYRRYWQRRGSTRQMARARMALILASSWSLMIQRTPKSNSIQQTFQRKTQALAFLNWRCLASRLSTNTTISPLLFRSPIKSKSTGDTSRNSTSTVGSRDSKWQPIIIKFTGHRL